MGLFNLVSGKVIIEPDRLPIPEFKVLYERDKSKTKDNAQEELSYVYFMADFNSPYAVIPDNKREEAIKRDFIKQKGWKVDKEVKAAISKYIELTETPNMRLLKSVRGTIDRMSEFLDTAEIDEHTIKSIIDTVTKTSLIISSYSKLEEAVKKDQTEGRSRGNKEIGDFER